VPLAEEVMKLLPRYCAKENVLGIGEIGYDDITPNEERFFHEQIQIAIDQNLPVLIHTPHRDKVNGTRRTLDVVKESGIAEELVMIDHLNEQTLPIVMDSGCWRAHSVYPNTKMSEQRMVALLQQYGTERMVVNSAADWGVSDPLKVPKTGDAMREAGFSDEVISQVLFKNPILFYEQSGKISLKDITKPMVDQTQTWEDNSALRGQEPIVDTL
jgi:predicted metal-dependent TIM-barrel fold hydrolase